MAIWYMNIDPCHRYRNKRLVSIFRKITCFEVSILHISVSSFETGRNRAK